jgi:hypothetical protein
MIWFSRRGPRAKLWKEAPAAPISVGAAEPRLSEVLKYEHAYWRQTAVTVASMFGMVLVFAVFVSVSSAIGHSFGEGPVRLSARLDISFGAGAVALGILSTLVIALQVSVRGTPASDDPERILCVARRTAFDGCGL